MICEYCKKDFEHEDKKCSGIYCSPECKRIARSEKTKRTLMEKYGVDHP